MDPTTKYSQNEKENFVTVVAIGSESTTQAPTRKCDSFSSEDSKSSGYVTVLTIGDSDEDCVPKDIIEEVLVYRLPGERLGFGLKFEGGTKANEFVKRLFIQSCAPDSPASRVQSSWGKLTEGDEVLEIDCMPVNSMTRIDCVRCLKDSNVVIKLLVRHFNSDCKQSSESKTRSVEDLPQVISAEKKRTPPPPPPVPPRKIPKKFYKNNPHQNNQHESNPVPAARQINAEVTVNGNKNKKFQSPRSSGRSSYSPDIPRRDRRFSDGSLGPPDAEVYVDLFSQESTQSLSESDDTGSSISTVVDRFGSFPTTTTSSLAGSLPSTPTSMQKHMDFSSLVNSYEDEDLTPIINRNVQKQNYKNSELNERDKVEEKSINDDGTPLQPPSCFQDAPLSYGNEDMRIIETKSNEINMCETAIAQEKKSMNNNSHCEKNSSSKNSTIEEKVFKKPPVPPRSRDLINGHKVNGCKEIQNIHDENMNISNLPRLVDFVPKSTSKEAENPVDIINIFLENERRDNSYIKNDYFADEEIDANDYSNEIDLYSSKWSLSSQLATIGEVEEEGSQEVVNRSPINSPPIVIVENADNDATEEAIAPIIQNSESVQNDELDHEGINGKMETLPSDSRQPPDGHEFPDYVEASEQSDSKFARENYHELYDKQLCLEERSVKPSLMNTYKSIESVNSTQNRSSFNDFSSLHMQSPLTKINSVSNSDLSSINSRDPFDSGDEVTLRRKSLEPTLHTRSQSLIDMTSISKQKSDRWSLLAEQRRKGWSKLKGLVIPEHVSESDPIPAVNIPEIISHTPSFVLETKMNANESAQCHLNETEPVALPLTSPPWTSNTNTFPKYSPAFKRKSLQVYQQAKAQKPEELSTAINKSPAKTVPNEKYSATLKQKLDTDDLRLDNLSDSPKSLESITSPTRSDCSFDYVTNSFGKVKCNGKQESGKTYKESFNYASKLHKDIGKSEDESDNDSAVSSSQSSYISRCSPPPSPTRSCEMLDYESNVRTKSDTIQDVDKYSNLQCRLLKAASVEAINRKNILASAKCRSGRDLKVGSPVIQRKYEENDSSQNNNSIPTENTVPSDQPPVTKPGNCNLNDIRATLKEKRSFSCEEPPPSMVNGDSKSGVADSQKPEMNHSSLPTKTSEKNNLITLKPVAGSLKNFPVQLREKVPPKNNFTMSNSVLKNNKSMSVTDLRKSFEKFGAAPPPLPQNVAVTVVAKEPKTVKVETKISKIESTIEKKPKPSTREGVKQEAVKAVTNTTPIPTNVQKEEASTGGANKRKVVLCPEFVGGSIGITLAGGTDYETKEITIHKIRYGSVAYNDGNLKKGDRIISINGKSVAGLTHAESVEMLKEAVAKFVLVVEDGKEEPAASSPQRKSFIYEAPEPKSPGPSLPAKDVTHVITLTKDGTGLGFSIEGGKDSPQGDLPLRVKKVFQGGPAEKSGKLNVGDELLAINDVSVVNLSRIEAWSLMKKLPDGDVSIHIHR